MTASRQARGGTLILGGGFAGGYVARLLRGRGATIVSRENFMLYTPMLPEAASGTLEPRHVVVPLRMMCPHAELVLGEIVSLDEAARTVVLRNDAGELAIGYERLVVALGSVARMLPIPGLAEHALGFKSLADGIVLRNHVLRRLEAAEAEPDPAAVERHLTFVFVGAGYAARELAGRGVEIRVGTTLDLVSAAEAVLSDGSRIPTATVVWTAGVTSSPLVAELGLPLDERGRVRVDATLRVEERERVWSLGDCARVPNEATPDRFDPPTCQHALRQARRLAKNLVGPPEPYRYRMLGQVATLGRYKGIADVTGLRLRGFPGWFFTRAYHLYQLPLLSRKLRVVVDWTVSLAFRRDIVELGTFPPRQEPRG